MSPVELIALSLGLSIAVAAVAGLAAAGLERVTTDPTLRDRAWAWTLYLPILPPLSVAATLLTPAPIRPIPILPTPVLTTQVIETLPVAAAPVVPAFALDMGQMATGALILAALLLVFRLASLILRGWRLNRLIARTEPVSTETRAVVAERAARLDVANPVVRAGPNTTDALLAGLTRPVLVLPQALAETPDTPAARAVITHELAHLKRGDHRAVWIEEAVLALLAVNPLLPLIRARRAAAREEACDALALTGAEPAARRAYATSLIEALRARTDPPTLPALTFHGTSRSQAMRRLKSILTPPATAGRRTRLGAAAAGIGLIVVSGLASVAVASHREVKFPAATVTADPERADMQRLTGAGADDLRLFCAAPDSTRDSDLGCNVALWTAADREERQPTGAFCTPATSEAANLDTIAERARTFVLTATDTSGSADDAARRALIAAFPCQGEARQPTAAEVAEVQASLAAEWSARHAARSAAESAAQAARMRAQTVADIKRECAAGGDVEAGCDGLIFGFVIGENMKQSAERAFCAPESQEDGPDVADTVKAAIVRTQAPAAESSRPFLTRVMTEIYPCDALQLEPARSDAPEDQIAASVAEIPAAQPSDAAAATGTTRMTVRLDVGQQPLALRNGDKVVVVLEGGRWGRSYRQEVSTGRTWGFGSIAPQVQMDLDRASVATGGQYRLRAEVQDRSGNRLYASLGSVPVTIQDQAFAVNMPLRPSHERSR